MARFRRVFIIQPNAQYIDMFNRHGDYIVVDKMEDADLLQFTGGSDVTPSYYGEEAHPATHNNPPRDAIEEAIFKTNTGPHMGLNLPMAGICRGGQFLHVMNGGKMYQHVDGHCGIHKVRDVDTGDVIEVSSTHHQMMRDSYVEDGNISEVLAVADGVSDFKESMVDGHAVRSRVWPVYDLEAIFFPITRTLCFQPHPEFGGYEACRDLYFKYLDDCIFTKGDG